MAKETNPSRQYAPATRRNREPIATILDEWLPATGTVLEIASGTGEHAIYFSERFPHLDWQPSDPDPTKRESILAWSEWEKNDHILPPLDLDTCAIDWATAVPTNISAILCINMIHIAPYEAALGLLRGSAALLPRDGALILYGPYRRNGEHTAPSNADFDAGLRDQNPSWGVRNLEDVTADASLAGFVHAETREMPANNLMVRFKRP